MSALDAVELVDSLYRRAVESPTSIDESSLAEWMEEALESISHDPGSGQGTATGGASCSQDGDAFRIEPRRFP